MSIAKVEPVMSISSVTQTLPGQINIFLRMAQVQGALVNESLKKQDEARAKAKAAYIIEGIMQEISKSDVLDVEGMRSKFEEMRKNLAQHLLSAPLEEALHKADTALVQAIEIKKKVDEIAKEAEKINGEFTKEVQEHSRLVAKLAAKKKELSKYSWVPGYGGALAIEVLILQGKVSSAAKRVQNVQERLGAKQVEYQVFASQLNDRKEILVNEMGMTAQKLSNEAENDKKALQTMMDSALQFIHLITGGD